MAIAILSEVYFYSNISGFIIMQIKCQGNLIVQQIVPIKVFIIKAWYGTKSTGLKIQRFGFLPAWAFFFFPLPQN